MAIFGAADITLATLLAVVYLRNNKKAVALVLSVWLLYFFTGILSLFGVTPWP